MSEWVAWIDSFGQWAAARVLYGFFVAPVETLPEISIADTYFAHERGSYLGGYALVLNAGNFIAPLIAGFMNDAYGWHWVQHWCALLLALNFVLAFFLQEETLFTRESVEAEAAHPTSGPFSGNEPGATNSTAKTGHNIRDEASRAISNDVSTCKARQKMPEDFSTLERGETYEKLTFWGAMSLWRSSGLTAKQILTLAWRPAKILIFFPNILWTAFMLGFATVW